MTITTEASQNDPPVSTETAEKSSSSPAAPSALFVRSAARSEINRQVIRRKLARQRHCIIPQAIDPNYLQQSIFPRLLQLFQPQTVHYNGGIAQVPRWKISCYLEVLPGGIPTAEPHLELLTVFTPLLDACNDLFRHWYRQQHACNQPASNNNRKDATLHCRRLMTFVTRYTPNPGEQALLKHVDGAGKVDGSVVVALPMEQDSPFEGGGLTLWDGRRTKDPLTGKSNPPAETHYDTRSGDVAFIDRAVWHQADPITKGTRWALVIFYKVTSS